MMNRNHSFMLVLLGLFFIACLILVAGCNAKETNVESIQSTENFALQGLTLLERKYADADSDGNDESIELYTSAEIAPDGQMGWDTGHQWVLLVRKGEEIFPLFDDWVQHGELEFWVVNFNKNKISGPESMDLEKHIYVMNSTSVSIKLFDYYWDERSLSFKKEVAFDPPDQWDVTRSNKYDFYDPFRIEPEGLSP